MEIYLVGGAVRDTLLGLPVKDRDWVVVGASPQQLITQGYTPVGKDFPVFLHPVSREEYALARTERNTAPGYKGFAIRAAPDVTLEQDLARRDLTINAMAVSQQQLDAAGNFDPEQVQLDDPFRGRRDLQLRQLRHVTDAFQEDPVRILRVARFAARFVDFRVADETGALMRRMVVNGEVDALVAERVWQELSRGLMEPAPSRLLAVLGDCGALAHLLPEWIAPRRQAADTPPELAHRLDLAAHWQAPLTVRYAIASLFMADDNARNRVTARLRVPHDCRDLALLAARERAAVNHSVSFDAPSLMQVLVRCDALRKPARFAELLQVCAVMAHAHADDNPAGYAPRTRLMAALAAAQAVVTDAVAYRVMASGLSGPDVGAAIHAARVQAVASVSSDPNASSAS